MPALKLRKWHSAQHLKTEEDMALYMEACLQEAGDDAAKALGTIARAKGMSQLSRVRAWAGTASTRRCQGRATPALPRS